MTLQGARIHIGGTVQGVGFRPFVYGLATRLGLYGWVRNTSAGVDIEVDGIPENLQRFIHGLRQEQPALAHIDELEVAWTEANGFRTFEIVHSESLPAEFQPVSPDVCICPDCLGELFDPQDRRYRYPFINCTNCGPRFTIIKDIPYDRPLTTMAEFEMCPECAAEYRDPLDRRFHAQPVACPKCGPQIWLELGSSGQAVSRLEQALQQARQLLREGKILAIKGLGGFHLACDATNPQAVAELRRRKLRVDKPFALMMADPAAVEAHCLLSPLERGLLEQRERPIVILRRRSESPIAAQVAPGQNTLGVMLPYTPLHYLLFASPDRTPLEFDMPPLVMTSGNLSEEPICTANAEARQRLASLADAFLMHDREIHVRCDDSVVSMFPPTRGELGQKRSQALYPLRRARGFAPGPLRLNSEAPALFAAGAELKNTFCLTRGRYAFLSHHIGDLENYETLASYEQAVAHYERLFRVKPGLIACDLHPDYLSTRYAQARAEAEGLPLFAVQHHHAHITACMAENGLGDDEPVIGVAFDGTGYGEDGTIWGGEFLLSGYASYERVAHLACVPLPGGDQTVREPWRMALAWLRAAQIEWEEDLPPVRHANQVSEPGRPVLSVLRRQMETGLNSPATSSMGRLFDAAAALLGVRQVVNYEAQAAIEMEAMIDGHEPSYYLFEYREDIIDAAPVFRGIVQDLRAGVAVPRITARFHGSVAKMVQETCRTLGRERGVRKIALSGGVWQNSYLLALTVGLLQEDRFEILLHRQVPANDGGISLGQAVSAVARSRNL